MLLGSHGTRLGYTASVALAQIVDVVYSWELLTRLVSLTCACSVVAVVLWVEVQEVEVGRHTVAGVEERHVLEAEEGEWH